MSEPVFRTMSRAEMLEQARRYMLETYGSPKDATDRDKWHERYGMLIDFVTEVFP